MKIIKIEKNPTLCEAVFKQLTELFLFKICEILLFILSSNLLPMGYEVIRFFAIVVDCAEIF